MSARSKPFLLAMSAILAIGGLIVTTSGSVAAAAPTWQTTFRDDFSGSGLPDPANWQLTLGTAYPGGPAAFGTGEIQTMTNNPNNVAVRNGNLYITPQRDSAGAWTSARVESNRANFKPADGGIMRVETRLQMPNVTGAEAMGYWPAFWMLGGPYRADRWSWPRIGEIDIMENVQGFNWTYHVLHCGTWGGPCNEPEGINNGIDNAGFACKVTTCQAGFHTYGMEWDRSGSQDQLRFYVDGELTFTVNQNQVPAQTWSDLADHAGYFMILNVAIGGAFPNKLGGGPTAATRPGVPMIVDYVEVKYAGGQGSPTTTVSPTVTSPAPTTTTAPPSPTVTTTSQPTTTAQPTTTVPPTGSAPSNLRVTGTSSSSITIGWNGSATGSYDVLRSGQRIATVTGTGFTDRGLLPNTPYLYSIRGAGVTTPVLTATLASTPTAVPTTAAPPTTAPVTSTGSTPPAATGTPGNLRVAGTTISTITLAWDGSTGASYEVLRSGIRIATVTGPGFTDIGLFRSTPYLYSVRGNGITTPVLTATIP
jgi:beta-glucanase (GH16 family)